MAHYGRDYHYDGEDYITMEEITITMVELALYASMLNA